MCTNEASSIRWQVVASPFVAVGSFLAFNFVIFLIVSPFFSPHQLADIINASPVLYVLDKLLIICTAVLAIRIAIRCAKGFRQS